ncbi:MAG: ferrous iron transport protein B [Chitinophagales bacterium]|nr:ferrous iron transport protein B [Bacteroidota bacterium]
MGNNIALVGNPNSGKSSIFNRLTGMRQQVGNYPGITVEQKTGNIRLPNQNVVQISDIPGSYSIHPYHKDDSLVLQLLTNHQTENFPELLLYVADATQLERHFLLLSQINDLNFPIILILTMTDVAKKEGIEINLAYLSEILQMPIVCVNGRNGEGIDSLKNLIQENLYQSVQRQGNFKDFPSYIDDVAQICETHNPYLALLYLQHFDKVDHLSEAQKNELQKIKDAHGHDVLDWQVKETMGRFDDIAPIMQKAIKYSKEDESSIFTQKVDRVLTHPFWGLIIFIVLNFLIFQAIFSWASYPMNWIESIFGNLSAWLKSVLPDNLLTQLLTDGLLAGIGGIVVFIPQIAILFALITFFEEIGYMARTVYLSDGLMRRLGMNGRSIISLMSGLACAVPAIMATRNISNWKERFITIMVTPFVSCSARIPVYTILVALVIPSSARVGIFNLQGIVMLGLYALGIGMALLAAFILHKILKSSPTGYLALELPQYKMPHWKNVAISVWNKVSTFVTEAGKIILVLSMMLWILATFGPGNAMQKAEEQARATAVTQQLTEAQIEHKVASARLEASYIGIIGKKIEPVIRPLGFNWKIGIALISSFAAREVFVGTMATIYSVGEDETNIQLKEKLKQDRFSDTGAPVYTLATCMALLLFYVFAMQCMSTLAVTKKETNSWLYPAIQFLAMTAIAYLAAWAAYQFWS